MSRKEMFMLVLVSPWGTGWGPGLYLELRPAPGKQWGGGRSGGCEQAPKSQGTLGQVQGDSGKEGEVWQGLQKEQGNQGQVPWSHTQYRSPCPGLAPQFPACREPGSRRPSMSCRGAHYVLANSSPWSTSLPCQLPLDKSGRPSEAQSFHRYCPVHLQVSHEGPVRP